MIKTEDLAMSFEKKRENRGFSCDFLEKSK